MHRDGIRSARGDAIVSRDIPIIFSAPMIKALLDGRKAMTRRLRMQRRKTAPTNEAYDHYYVESPWTRVKVGDRLWVREAFAFVGCSDPGLVVTRADYPACVPAHYENVPP
jgi:hypothetical protein